MGVHLPIRFSEFKLVVFEHFVERLSTPYSRK
jgi:hypothetical protein